MFHYYQQESHFFFFPFSFFGCKILPLSSTRANKSWIRWNHIFIGVHPGDKLFLYTDPIPSTSVVSHISINFFIFFLNEWIKNSLPLFQQSVLNQTLITTSWNTIPIITLSACLHHDFFNSLWSSLYSRRLEQDELSWISI